jgi:DNA-binding PadR family transcriptional regulator
MFFRHFHGAEPRWAARDEFAWGRHERHGRHGGGFRGRDARVFEHGDLRLVIMAMLRERPRYGYEIIKELEERVGGGYSPSPGVVYPTLTLLEEVGHATVSDEAGGRRLYTLSAEGLAFLEANRTQVDAILAVGSARDGEPRLGASPSPARAASQRRPHPGDRGGDRRGGQGGGGKLKMRLGAFRRRGPSARRSPASRTPRRPPCGSSAGSPHGTHGRNWRRR